MAYHFQIECEECGSKLHIVEDATGIIDNMDTERGYCCECGELVAEFMTDGVISVSLLEKGNKDE